jgi:hypothetical protein
MKISAEEFKEWHDTAWPDDCIWCDESTLPDGRDIYDENGELALTPGEVFIIPDYWTIAPDGEINPEGMAVVSLIRAWRQKRDTVILMIRVPKTSEGELRAFVTEHPKWKVLI